MEFPSAVYLKFQDSESYLFLNVKAKNNNNNNKKWGGY